VSVWRCFVTPPLGGTQNMALDEALMERARTTGEWVMRVYSWRHPTISLGRNQTARGCYDLDRVRDLALDVVRRPTGGRAILHDHEVTYSVTAPAADAGELRASYVRINELLLHALRSLGARAELAPNSARSTRPGPAPCFAEPSPGELVLDGRKLAGSAQWRADGALLQHGSILVGDDQSLLATLSLHADRDMPLPATLTEALGRAPSVDETADALRRAISSVEGIEPTDLRWEDDESLRARSSALVVRYEDDRWTWRR
jgi:lipoate-protein ligase A